MADSIGSSSSASSAPTAPFDQSIASSTTQGLRKRRRSLRQSSTIPPESKISKSSAVSPKYMPKVLTGAAALDDEQRAREEQAIIEARQSSPNPARKALGDLLGAQSGGMSRLQDAPSEATTLSEPLADVASFIQVPTAGATALSRNESTVQTSPQSTASFGTLVSTPTGTITANGASVASPGQMDDVVGEDEEGPRKQDHRQMGDDAGCAEPEEGRSNKAFTYPGPMLGAQAHRTQSLPQSGYGRDSTRSPSNKRHKCPYCSTDFTRHHNLKSHLLTHSHEKPYSCDTCDARFRRLHDLKRHTKLHTGERPHICPKCDRSFARGDALARHNKGVGGCAGRRSSMGSFGADDKSEERMKAGDGESMPGVMYTGETSHEPEHMEEDSGSPGGTRFPSIRRHEASADEHHRQPPEHPSMYLTRQPSTYPPVAARPPAGGLYPPPIASPRGGSGASSAQSSTKQPSYPPPPGAAAPGGFQSSGPNVFAQGGMTESPKPLSPGGMTSHQLGHSDSGIHRNRSPSLTQQFQQQRFGRRTTGHNTSPPMSLPPPHPGASHSHAPQLPSLPGLTPPEPRFTLHSQAPGPSQSHSSAPNSLPGPTHGSNSPSYPPGNMSSTNNSLSSHGTGPPTSFDRAQNVYSQPSDQLWAYVQQVQALEAKVNLLQDEVLSLKRQLNGGNQHIRPVI